MFDCSLDAERAGGLVEAGSAIRRGDLVVMPTDTVYGVAADAFNPSAVNLLLAVKGRGRDMPVPVLVASRQMADAVVESMSDEARALAEEFWPGALTLVVRHTPHLAWDLGETRGTVAVRVPDHPLAISLIEQTGPLAVSSANRTGNPPPLTAMDARLQLGSAIAVYLDAGPASAAALPSSIVDVTGEEPRLLRAGALDAERLRGVVPALETDGS
ncbi:MAG TPA: L-threonylcarbamoyladenylate synthase [Mycobacteriales bacterium]|nr:L-threonylcarbamoyladenylate synthase [Mycobacteriales bacterium]